MTMRQNPSVPQFAPEILRQRLLVEGYYTTDVDRAAVERFLHGIAAHLTLRSYGQPAIFAPGGEGREENQGFDAFLPLIDSGISLYVWTELRFVSTVLFTCRAFDDGAAVVYVKEFFGLTTFERHSF
jgi:S-adenosylmethionine decarboxylase